MGHAAPAIWATSIVATGLAMECHEWAHVVAGRLAGGVPTLITTTETKGDFSALSPAGFVALGGAGFLANLLLAAFGFWLLRRKPGDGGARLFAWFSLAINGTIVATAMLGESAAAFGDWITILRPFPGLPYTRIAVAILGFLGILFIVRRAGTALGGTLVPVGDRRQRRADALRILLNGAAAATFLALGGAVANPLGTLRSTLLALGASLGPFLVLLGSVRHALRVPPVESAPPPGHTSWLWHVGAAGVTAFMWIVLGPGISFGG